MWDTGKMEIRLLCAEVRELNGSPNIECNCALTGNCRRLTDNE